MYLKFTSRYLAQGLVSVIDKKRSAALHMYDTDIQQSLFITQKGFFIAIGVVLCESLV